MRRDMDAFVVVEAAIAPDGRLFKRRLGFLGDIDALDLIGQRHGRVCAVERRTSGHGNAAIGHDRAAASEGRERRKRGAGGASEPVQVRVERGQFGLDPVFHLHHDGLDDIFRHAVEGQGAVNRADIDGDRHRLVHGDRGLALRDILTIGRDIQIVVLPEIGGRTAHRNGVTNRLEFGRVVGVDLVPEDKLVLKDAKPLRSEYGGRKEAVSHFLFPQKVPPASRHALNSA